MPGRVSKDPEVSGFGWCSNFVAPRASTAFSAAFKVVDPHVEVDLHGRGGVGPPLPSIARSELERQVQISAVSLAH